MEYKNSIQVCFERLLLLMVTMIMCNIFNTYHQHFLFLKMEIFDDTLIKKGWETHPLHDMSIGQNKSLKNKEFSIVMFPTCN